MAPTPPTGAPLPAHSSTAQARSEIERAAQEFESVFIGEMLAPMFEGIDTEGLGGGGIGEEMFRPMLIERYAEAIAHAGGIGVAQSIVAEFTRMQTTPGEDEYGAGR